MSAYERVENKSMRETKKNPLVSIIIPVYNVEKYLDKCLRSVTSQSYRNLEIILIDDGSIDSSGEMCDEWAKKDERIKAIHQKNAGVSAARNKGIEKATGDFILFVDGDDWIKRETVKLVVEQAQKTEADIVVFGLKIFDATHQIYTDWNNDSKNELAKYQETFSWRNDPDNFLIVITVNPVNKLFRSDFLREINFSFPVDLVMSEDTEAILGAVIQAKTISHVDQDLYVYRYNDNKSESRFKSDEHSLDWYKALKRVKKVAQSIGIYRSIAKGVNAAIWRNGINHLRSSEGHAASCMKIYQIMKKKLTIALVRELQSIQCLRTDEKEMANFILNHSYEEYLSYRMASYRQYKQSWFGDQIYIKQLQSEVSSLQSEVSNLQSEIRGFMNVGRSGKLFLGNIKRAIVKIWYNR
jgi:glycosyltransferase involved in cell wall biosynthesis